MRCTTLLVLLFGATTVYSQINPALLASIQANDLVALKKINPTPAMLNMQDKNGANTLTWAAYDGDFEMVKYLHEKGAAVPERATICIDSLCNDYYGNLTGIAAGEGKVEMLQYFIEELKIPINELEYNHKTGKKDGWAPLHWAASAGKDDVIEYLLEKRANLKVRDGKGKTPIVYLDLYKNERATVLLVAAILDKYPEEVAFLKEDLEEFGQDVVDKNKIDRRTQYGDNLDWNDIARYRLRYLRWQYLVKNPAKKKDILQFERFFIFGNGSKDEEFEKAAKFAEDKLEPSIFSKAYFLRTSNSIVSKDLQNAKIWFSKAVVATNVRFIENELLLSRLYSRIYRSFYADSMSDDASFEKYFYLNSKLNNELYERPNYSKYQLLNVRGSDARENRDSNSYSYDMHSIQYLDTLATLWPANEGFFRYLQMLLLSEVCPYYHDNYMCDKSKNLLQKGFSIFKKLEKIDRCYGRLNMPYRCISDAMEGLNIIIFGDCALYEFNEISEIIAYFEHSNSLIFLDDWSTKGRAYNLFSTQGLSQGGPSVQMKYPNLIHAFNLLKKDSIVLKIGLNATFRFKNSDFFSENALRNEIRKKPVDYKKYMQLYQSYIDVVLYKMNDQEEWGGISDSLETLIHQLAPNFKINSQSKEMDSQKLKINLSSKEAIMEIVQFPIFKGGYETETDSVPSDYRYLAYVLTKNDLQVFPLCTQSALEKHLFAADTVKNTATGVAKILYRGEVDPAYAPVTTGLFSLGWTAKFDSLLQKNKIETVWISPDGIFHRIPFAAIVDETGELLGKKYHLNTVISTRILAGKDTFLATKDLKPTAWLFGGINYVDKPLVAGIAVAPIELSSNPFAPYSQTLGVKRGESINPLPNTRIEVRTIANNAAITQWKVSLLTDSDASEEALKSLSGTHPTVVHLATHGYYRIAGRDTTLNAEDLPLFRSGVMLAGAQKAWLSSIGQGYPDQEDGILTAFEASLLDLTGTELVVLSACETGRGDIIESEGVFGLQRAFKLAGARYVLSSLWQVDDAQTANFMVEFYKRYFVCNDVRRAFNETQRYFIEKKMHPYFWAGFVLTE